MKRDLGSLDLKGTGGKTPPPKRKISGTLERSLVFFGILLPLAAILAENQFHSCAKYAFDPFPSSGHVFLCLLIPFASVLTWLSLRHNVASQFGPGLLTNGMAVGVAILYSLMFLPLAGSSIASFLHALVNFYPPASLFSSFAEVIVSCSPLLALLVLWLCGRRAAKEAAAFGTFFCPHQVKNAGHLVILLMVVALELPSTITRVALGMAASRESESSARGLAILRTFGSRDVMLRACYERSGRASDVLGSLYEASHPSDYRVMRNIFYKATGRTFNSFPIPEEARASMNHTGRLAYDGFDQGADDEFDSDPDVAGEVVSGVSRGLSVSQSKIQARVDSDAGTSKIDWFLDFNNKSKYDREVRTRIKLPHGAAVNEAGLIVNGKEYKCQITLKEQAREIYRDAVQRKRNPLLVSLAGEDTVLVQCYPVPPGNKLSLHLSAVSPLTLNKDLHAILSLPQFEERNFQITVPHTIELSANHEIENFRDQLDKSTYDHPEANLYKLSGSLDCSKLASGAAVVGFQRGKENSFWCKDQNSSKVIETISDLKWQKPAKLTVLIDGSLCMRDNIKEIADALKKLPKDQAVKAIFIGDRGTQEFSPAEFDKLANVECIGGQLDGDVLGRSLQDLSAPDTTVLWIHGQQPAAENPFGEQSLLPWFLQSHGVSKPILYDMQLYSGPNQYLDGVDSVAVQKVPRFGSCAQDLELLFDIWQKPGTIKTFSRQHLGAYANGLEIAPVPYCGPVSVSTNDADSLAKSDTPAVADQQNVEGKETASELAQLWAYDEIHRLVRAHDEYHALRLAEQYKLVTPVSSAVLVDTVEDLDRMSCPVPVAICDSLSNSTETCGTSSFYPGASPVSGVASPTTEAIREKPFNGPVSYDSPAAAGGSAGAPMPMLCVAPNASPAPIRTIVRRSSSSRAGKAYIQDFRPESELKESYRSDKDSSAYAGAGDDFQSYPAAPQALSKPECEKTIAANEGLQKQSLHEEIGPQQTVAGQQQNNGASVRNERDATVIQGVNTAGCCRTSPVGGYSSGPISVESRTRCGESYDDGVDYIEALQRNWFALLGFALATFVVIYKFVDGVIGKVDSGSRADRGKTRAETGSRKIVS